MANIWKDGQKIQPSGLSDYALASPKQVTGFKTGQVERWSTAIMENEIMGRLEGGKGGEWKKGGGRLKEIKEEVKRETTRVRQGITERSSETGGRRETEGDKGRSKAGDHESEAGNKGKME
ncbi:hypothetical protein RRG08_063400 [Elysia crispata]|uniref:Uncharacterized protein n=1 Tax=Elysia crispata TaxID=231223 RepID=A0AAE1A9Z7_9GAST|nr:hypothetical protein RRG08_063400 [Elysia crispata]